MNLDNNSQKNDLAAALSAIGGHLPPLTADAALLARIDAITAILGPQLDEILQAEAGHIGSDADWARSEGLYLCSIIGGYRKLLSTISSTARLCSSDPEPAWHLLVAAGLTARQLVGMIASPEVGDAANRAAVAFGAQTELYCAAAAAGFATPLPDPDLARLLGEGVPSLPLATTETMAGTIAAIEAGEQATDLALPIQDLYPIASAPTAPDETAEFQCHLASELLDECTAVAFAEIDGLCLSDEWAAYALAIATPSRP